MVIEGGKHSIYLLYHLDQNSHPVKISFQILYYLVLKTVFGSYGCFMLCQINEAGTTFPNSLPYMIPSLSWPKEKLARDFWADMKQQPVYTLKESIRHL